MGGSSSSLHHLAIITLFLFHCMAYYCLGTTPIPIGTTKSTDFIRNSCNTTLYPQLCYKSISRFAAKIKTNPKTLAQAALCFTLASTRSSARQMKNMSRTLDLKGGEAALMDDCLEELDDSIYELKNSVKELGRRARPGSDFERQMNDIQTWVSAALTDDDTCMDGFTENKMNGEVKSVVRRLVLRVAHLASIALALVNNYAST